MTICIAAICNGGSDVILATDSMSRSIKPPLHIADDLGRIRVGEGKK